MGGKSDVEHQLCDSVLLTMPSHLWIECFVPFQIEAAVCSSLELTLLARLCWLINDCGCFVIVMGLMFVLPAGQATVFFFFFRLLYIFVGKLASSTSMNFFFNLYCCGLSGYCKATPGPVSRYSLEESDK